MASLKNGSQFLAARVGTPPGRDQAATPNPAARAIMESATHLITIDGSYRDRLTRIARATERWVDAKPGREVVVIRGGSKRYSDRWIAVFVEDKKGILSVRGVTEEDAMENALALLEPPKPR